jgi:hypothetical protein
VSNYLKAISLWQPWASLWLSPNKLHETRHWATTYRGALLVHAAKKFVKDVDPELEDILDSEFGHHWDLPTGALIGIVNLVAIVPVHTLPPEHADSDDYQCGDFSEGRFAWRRGTYRRFPEPIPYRGQQALFDVPYAVVAQQIDAALEIVA